MTERIDRGNFCFGLGAAAFLHRGFFGGPRRIVYLTVEQIDRLLEAATHSSNYELYPFIRIGLDTSMGAMEILSVRRENIDLGRRMIYITNAKAGPREQPMTQDLATYLREYMAILPEDTPWLFPSLSSKPSKVGHTVDINRVFRIAVETAGLDPAVVVRHTLRHTAITHLVQAGVDLPAVKRISGHKTLLMVERYSHQDGTRIQAAMDKLSARYRSNAG
jgi:integrase